MWTAFDKKISFAGPWIPSEVGYWWEVIDKYSQTKGYLVVVWVRGHAEVFGGRLTTEAADAWLSHAIKVRRQEKLFSGLNESFKVGDPIQSGWVMKKAITDCLK